MKLTHRYPSVPELQRTEIARIDSAAIGEDAQQGSLYHLGPHSWSTCVQSRCGALTQRIAKLLQRFCNCIEREILFEKKKIYFFKHINFYIKRYVI